MRKFMGSIFFYTLLITALVFTSCGKDETEEITGASWDEDLSDEPGRAVDILVVSSGALVPAIATSGIIEGIQEGVVVSQSQGMITEVFHEIGEYISSGEALLKIDDSVAALNLEQAREEMENAEITLAARERLAESGGVSQAELLRARSSYRGAQSLFERSLKTYEDMTLRSPINGVLAWRASDLEAGNYLAAGQTVYRLEDLSGIKVAVSVGERQVGIIEPGNEVTINIPSARGIGVLSARVKAVSSASDRTTGSFMIIVEAGNPKDSGIRAGMSASVNIYTSDPRQGLIIPFSSVVHREGASYVFIEKEGRATPMEISTGESLGNRMLVESGLEEDQNLIITGLSELKPGDPVIINPRGFTGDYL